MSSSENSQSSTTRTTYAGFTQSRSRTVAVSTGRGGQTQVKRMARKGLRDLPPLDLRTPSGRELPF